MELGPFTLKEGFDFCITRRSGLSSAAVGLSGERASVVSGVGVEPGTGASSRLKASCFHGGRKKHTTHAYGHDGPPHLRGPSQEHVVRYRRRLILVTLDSLWLGKGAYCCDRYRPKSAEKISISSSFPPPALTPRPSGPPLALTHAYGIRTDRLR